MTHADVFMYPGGMNKTVNDHIADAQDAILDITVGMTRVVHGHAVTRWTDEDFEVGTWGVEANWRGSESAAEAVVAAL